MQGDLLSRLIGRPAIERPMPVTGRYPPESVTAEVVKGGIGFALCAGIVVALNPTPWVAWPLGIVAALFVLYTVQQLRRFPLRVEVSESGVNKAGGGGDVNLPWAALADLRLNYYPHGRKARTGLLVLILKGERGRIKVDSGMDQFPTLLARAARAARERELELHPTTEDNLGKLGL